MRQTATARTPTSRTSRATAVGLVLVAAGIAGTLVLRPASSSTIPGGIALAPGAPHVVPESTAPSTPSLGAIPRVDRRGPAIDGGGVTRADGALPAGGTVFDDAYPRIASLDAGLREALREAARDAAADGVRLQVTSGWRSREYQDRLFREAVDDHGSAQEAARWVATADTSSHVSGDAVDIGPADAASWLARHGAAYGLCRIYRNEPWHFELRPEAVGHACPPLYDDPTHDPRMQP